MDLEQVIKQSQGERYVYPDIFPDNCGLDIVLPNDKLHAVRSWGYRKNNPKRRATLQISTFRGISFNAIHYYGKINIQGVNMEVDGEPGRSRMVFDDNIPLAHYTYELELKRPLSKEEISEDPERWGDYYNEGDLTNCFNTIEDIIALAKEVFRLRFIGDWEFYVESPYNRYDGKLDINNQQTEYE
jgi:hypothetical protein